MTGRQSVNLFASGQACGGFGEMRFLILAFLGELGLDAPGFSAQLRRPAHDRGPLLRARGARSAEAEEVLSIEDARALAARKWRGRFW